jgi:hypothetical protein
MFVLAKAASMKLCAIRNVISASSWINHNVDFSSKERYE